MRQISRLMKSNCLGDGSMSRGNTWDGRLKCHAAGKRHEKLILWANRKTSQQVFLNASHRRKFTWQLNLLKIKSHLPSHDVDCLSVIFIYYEPKMCIALGGRLRSILWQSVGTMTLWKRGLGWKALMFELTVATQLLHVHVRKIAC